MHSGTFLFAPCSFTLQNVIKRLFSSDFQALYVAPLLLFCIFVTGNPYLYLQALFKSLNQTY